MTITAPPEHSADLELAVTAEPVPRTQWQLFRRRFMHHKLAVFGLIMLIAITIMCFFPGIFARGHHNGFDISTALSGAQGPSMKHWLGTDEQGQDFFYVLLKSGQISLKIGFVVAIVSTTFGVFLGSAAGYFGKWVDGPLSALTDLFLVMPFLAVIAVLLQYEGHSAGWIIVALSLFGWTYVARISRGQVLQLKQKEFVEAAQASGAPSRRIIGRHMLPNMFGPIMVNLTLSVAYAIVAESTLTFLGFGIQAPQTSWGLLLSDNEGAVNDTSKIHLLLFPGLMLLIVVLCVNFIGDGLRDAFDPQAKHST
ncbi:MAG TPA: ABC transporter permease [Acidimicrobiia bacterium]